MEEASESELPKPSNQKSLNAINLVIAISGLFLVGSIGTISFFTLGIWAAIAAATVLLLVTGLILLYFNIDTIWPSDSNNDYYSEDIEQDELSPDTSKIQTDQLKENMQSDPELANEVSDIFLTATAAIIQLGEKNAQRPRSNQGNLSDPPLEPLTLAHLFLTPQSPPTTTPKPQPTKEEQDYKNILDTIETHRAALLNIVKSPFPGNNVAHTIGLLNSNPREAGYEHCINKTLSSIDMSGNVKLIQRKEEIRGQLNEHFSKLKAALIQQHNSPLFHVEEKKRENQNHNDRKRQEDHSNKLDALGVGGLIGYCQMFATTPNH